MDGNGVWKFPEGSGRQGREERYCCNVICDAPTTSEVKGLRWEERYIVFQFQKIVKQVAANNDASEQPCENVCVQIKSLLCL